MDRILERIQVRITLPDDVEDRAHGLESGKEIWAPVPAASLNNGDI